MLRYFKDGVLLSDYDDGMTVFNTLKIQNPELKGKKTVQLHDLHQAAMTTLHDQGIVQVGDVVFTSKELPMTPEYALDRILETSYYEEYCECCGPEEVYLFSEEDEHIKVLRDLIFKWNGLQK